MRSNITLGRIFGVEVGLHYSWLLIALLITLSLSDRFHALNPAWGPLLIWATSLVTAGLFFVTLVAHELSHVLTARRFGISTRAITLFALGGVAQIEGEPQDAKSEFWIGIVGPLSSAIMGAASLGLAAAAGWAPSGNPHSPLQAMLAWLGFINLGLALFNMIPGYPLDGGRIFRGALWWFTGNAERSTRLAARIGQGIAICFIVWGILRFFNGEGFGGLWIAFIGWFLLQAAGASYANFALTSGLREVRVRDLMTRDCAVVDGRTNVERFVQDHLLRSSLRCFIVKEDERVLGLITPNEIATVDRARWPYTTIDDIMRPLDDLHTVSPATPVLEALQTMGRDDVNQLPVLEGGHLEGIITRGNVVQFLQTRMQFGR
ncbi:MAG: site-2 protease family protein [Acidobacteriaceae bacterium]|nr:site-2 protease family protein [Acidobacteriaceae bacterium]